jgi:hypothetical protein
MCLHNPMRMLRIVAECGVDCDATQRGGSDVPTNLPRQFRRRKGADLCDSRFMR